MNLNYLSIKNRIIRIIEFLCIKSTDNANSDFRDFFPTLLFIVLIYIFVPVMYIIIKLSDKNKADTSININEFIKFKSNTIIQLVLIFGSDILFIMLGLGLYFFPPTTILSQELGNAPLFNKWLIGELFFYEGMNGGFWLINTFSCMFYYGILLYGIFSQFIMFIQLIRKKIASYDSLINYTRFVSFAIISSYLVHTIFFALSINQMPLTSNFFIYIWDLNTLVPFIINFYGCYMIERTYKKIKKEITSLELNEIP